MTPKQLERATWILAAGASAAPTRQGASAVDCVQLHDAYAEPGYCGGPVATGNWNAVTRWDGGAGRSVTVDPTPARVGALLERAGFELEWSDEWTQCDQCGGLIRISPDSYCWQRSYAEIDCDIVCMNCIDPAELLKSLEGNSDTCNTLSDIDPADHGYVLVQSDYEAGLHYGQDAEPRLIADALRAQGIERFVFNLDSTGQFDVHFSVYVHESEADKLNREQFDSAETDGPSRAAACERALKDASAKMGALQGEGIRYAKCNADGTANVRLVSPEEFANGIKD